ncbi:MAG: cyclic nucleotide-binding domain-containing protein [Polyangiaceae bacterium]
MKLTALGATDVGRARDHNEDHFLVEADLGLFVVCDGMGGHASGEVASAMAANSVRAVVRAELGPVDAQADGARPADQVADVMRRAVEAANSAVHTHGKKESAGRAAGTTCTALCIRGNRGTLAHVGDTRLYLKRAGQTHLLSFDHSFLAEAMRRGVPYEEAVQNFPPNLLSRAVGPLPRVQVDTLEFDVLPGDMFVLCTDGLHGYLESTDTLAERFGGELASLPQRLVDYANEQGGADNITALIIAAGDGDAEEPERLSRVNQDLSALQTMELFNELTYPELLEVAGALRSEEYDADQLILREKESSRSMYVIAAGRVEVRRGETLLATLRSGSHFGEMALLTNRPRSANIRTLEPCRFLVLDQEQLYPLFQQNPVIGLKFLWRLAQILSLRLDEATLFTSPVPDTERRAPDMVGELGSELFPPPFSGKP